MDVVLCLGYKIKREISEYVDYQVVVYPDSYTN
jgi:hypothetical protein